MTYNLTMTVLNKSNETIAGYCVAHTFDGNTTCIAGTNLAPNDKSDGVTIASGHIHNDDYTVLVVFGNATQINPRFYCNASSSQDAVVIEVNADSVNAVYYEKTSAVTGCYDKT